MASVVNDHGTAVASKLPLDGILMAGKTGTAQVFRLGQRGHQGAWALRDHALFIAFAPADKPKYAIGCIIEHGGFGASAAAPIVRDSMTYLFDQQKALAALEPLEKQWGGTLAERNARLPGAFKNPPRVPVHDYVRNHPAPARAISVAADLPGCGDRPVWADGPLLGGWRLITPLGDKTGAQFFSFSSAWRSACPGFGSDRQGIRIPAYVVIAAYVDRGRPLGFAARARSGGSTWDPSACSRRNS